MQKGILHDAVCQVSRPERMKESNLKHGLYKKKTADNVIHYKKEALDCKFLVENAVFVMTTNNTCPLSFLK